GEPAGTQPGSLAPDPVRPDDPVADFSVLDADSSQRAAIEAVLAGRRLDIHEGARDRQRIAAGLGATLDQAARAADPDTSALHRRLTDRQRRLSRHAAALHRAHGPWRLSAYQVQSAL